MAFVGGSLQGWEALSAAWLGPGHETPVRLLIALVVHMQHGTSQPVTSVFSLVSTFPSHHGLLQTSNFGPIGVIFLYMHGLRESFKICSHSQAISELKNVKSNPIRPTIPIIRVHDSPVFCL